MKKVLSISFAFLILLSGMHFSFATHVCGGEVAAVKWSFSGEKATCGMEDESKSSCTTHNSIASNCCENIVKVYTVDNNFNPSKFQVKEIAENIFQIFSIPVSFSLHSFIATSPLLLKNIPPDVVLSSAVSLAEICIFRI